MRYKVHRESRKFNPSTRCPVTGKVKYRSKNTAERRRKYEHRSLGWENSKKVHKCPFCGAWHITHLTETRKRKMIPYKRNGRTRKGEGEEC